MDFFFISVLLIVAGGILALFFWRQFQFMKTVGTLTISVGCAIGAVDAAAKLFQPEKSTAVFKYLDAFSLSFQVDGLSAFFLVAIFGICLLAALYSFHYLNTHEKSLRIAANYFFFSLFLRFFNFTLFGNNG